MIPGAQSGMQRSGERAWRDHPRLDDEGFLCHVLGLDCILPTTETQEGSEPTQSACNGNGAWSSARCGRGSTGKQVETSSGEQTEGQKE